MIMMMINRKRDASRQAGSEIAQYLNPLHAPLLLLRHTHTNELFYTPTPHSPGIRGHKPWDRYQQLF